MPKVMFPLENATLAIANQPFLVRGNVSTDSGDHISVATLEEGSTIGMVGEIVPERGSRVQVHDWWVRDTSFS